VFGFTDATSKAVARLRIGRTSPGQENSGYDRPFHLVIPLNLCGAPAQRILRMSIPSSAERRRAGQLIAYMLSFGLERIVVDTNVLAAHSSGGPAITGA